MQFTNRDDSRGRDIAYLAKSFSDDGDLNVTTMWIAPMFEQENSLPGAECHVAVNDWNRLARSGQNHSDVGRHVIRSFIVMLVIGVFGHEFLEKSLKITTCGRCCVFHDHQAATRVLDEDRDRAATNLGFRDLLLDLVGDFVRAFAVSRNNQLIVIHAHAGEGKRDRAVSNAGPLSGGPAVFGGDPSESCSWRWLLR